MIDYAKVERARRPQVLRWLHIEEPQPWVTGRAITMWTFSYQGPGMKSMARADEPSPALGTAMEQITAAAEKQMVDKPEGVIPHIRAAAAAVKELVRASDETVSIVAEGWVESDGQASTTINVAVSPAVAETKR